MLEGLSGDMLLIRSQMKTSAPFAVSAAGDPYACCLCADGGQGFFQTVKQT